MRAYTNALADTVASYPSAVYTPRDARNRDNAISPVTETMVIPANGLMELEYAILKAGTITITDTTDAVVLTPRTWATAPTTSEVAVHWDGGFLRVHTDLAGNTIEVTYQPLGTVVTSGLLNRVQAEIVAVQTQVDTIGDPVAVAHGGTGLIAGPDYGLLCGNSGGQGYVALNGNELTTRKFLRSVGDGNDRSAPAWDTLAIGDLPGGGTWSLSSALAVGGKLTVNTEASGDDYKGVVVTAPASGTKRYGMWVDCPAGGTVNQGLVVNGGTYGAGHQIHAYDSGYHYYFGGTSTNTPEGSYLKLFGISSVMRYRSNLPQQWETASATLMKLDTSGNLAVATRAAIGTTTPPTSGEALQVTGSATVSTSGSVANYLAVGSATVPTSGNALQPTSATIGTSTNLLKVSTAGWLTLEGDATYWLDERGALVGARLESPSSDLVWDSDEAAYVFTEGCTTADYLLTNIQLNHDWKPGSSIGLHIHWLQSAAEIPHFVVYTRWQRQGQAKTTAWTPAKYSGHVSTWSTGKINQITYWTRIAAPTGYGVSDILQVRLVRDYTNASTLFSGTDPLASEVYVLDMDVHKECASLGSNTEYAM